MRILANILSLLPTILLLSSTSVFAIEVADNVYTEDKLNIVVEAKSASFVIKLKSNPTTGYAWFLREYNHELMVPVKHVMEAPESKLIGAPGYELWTFRMKPAAFTVPQQMTIRFVYARPWQGADNSSQVVFRVTTTNLGKV